jgi:hypothetical protein
MKDTKRALINNKERTQIEDFLTGVHGCISKI